MLKIGLTGGIGSGKTAVAKIFSDLNIPVIDSDAIAHQLTQPGTECLEKIVSLLGEEFLSPNGELDRKKTARHIFNNPDKKKALEDILHPQIKKAMLEEIEKSTSSPYVILVVPLLFETDFENLIDRSLVVDAPENTRIDRIKKRDNISDELIKSIINNQLDSATRSQKADDILNNSENIESLQAAVKQLHKTYLRLSGDI